MIYTLLAVFVISFIIGFVISVRRARRDYEQVTHNVLSAELIKSFTKGEQP
jgi:hypothetical protein